MSGVRRAVGVVAGCTLALVAVASCGSDEEAPQASVPFEFDEIATAEATVGGIFLEVDYGSEPAARRRGTVTRLGRFDGAGIVAAGVFVQSGGDGEGGTTYYPPDAGDVDAPETELLDRFDSFVIDELVPGDYIVCNRSLEGDICATFTVVA